MLCKWVPVHYKFKFSFLEFSWIFFPNIFDTRLVEPTDSKPSDMETYLYIEFLKFTKWINTIWPGDGVNIQEIQEGEDWGEQRESMIQIFFLIFSFS